MLCAGWGCGGVRVFPLLLVFPERCISSVSPRFYFRRHAFCFLLLVAILESLAVSNFASCTSVCFYLGLYITTYKFTLWHCDAALQLSFCLLEFYKDIGIFNRCDVSPFVSPFPRTACFLLRITHLWLALFMWPSSQIPQRSKFFITIIPIH
jgi:hypothetical protein